MPHFYVYVGGLGGLLEHPLHDYRTGRNVIDAERLCRMDSKGTLCEEEKPGKTFALKEL